MLNLVYLELQKNILLHFFGEVRKKLMNVLAIYIYVQSELKDNLLSKKGCLVLSHVFVTSEKPQY